MKAKIWENIKGESRFVYARNPSGQDGLDHYMPIWLMAVPALCVALFYALMLDGETPLYHVPFGGLIFTGTLWVGLATFIGFILVGLFYRFALTPKEVGTRFITVGFRASFLFQLPLFLFMESIGNYDAFIFTAHHPDGGAMMGLAGMIAACLAFLRVWFLTTPYWLVTGSPVQRPRANGRVIESRPANIPWHGVRIVPALRTIGFKPSFNPNTAGVIAIGSAVSMAWIVFLVVALFPEDASDERLLFVYAAQLALMMLSGGIAHTFYLAGFDVLENNILRSETKAPGDKFVLFVRDASMGIRGILNPVTRRTYKKAPDDESFVNEAEFKPAK